MVIPFLENVHMCCVRLGEGSVFLTHSKDRHFSSPQWAQMLICDCSSIRMKFFHPQRTPRNLSCSVPVLQSTPCKTKTHRNPCECPFGNKTWICHFVQFKTSVWMKYFKPEAVSVKFCLGGFRTYRSNSLFRELGRFALQCRQWAGKKIINYNVSQKNGLIHPCIVLLFNGRPSLDLHYRKVEYSTTNWLYY